MGILEKFFPAKTAITSAAIRAEIDHSEAEIARLQAEIGPKLAAIAAMTDAEHVRAEADIAATKRAIARLDARVAHLTNELPAVVAAEEAAQVATKNEALRQRAEDCRKMNAAEAKKLLADYDRLASQMGDVFARLNEIADETNSVNKVLSSNRVADSIVGYETLYRRLPAGHFEFPFSAIVLPAGFSGGKAHWPRS
ncbi:hypothetical protein [Nitrobacter sp.]|uniref:hypothetical protein n=1 Tax=Nitrobacter sp. TaxID=29420 RepID=UPI0029CAAFE8|nr:hypothetical protein [Nitrobacter sp.]